MSLENFFNPKSIAVVGASVTEGKVGNVIAKNLLQLGYAGQVFLVNPTHSEVLGKTAYPNLNAIEEKIDLAIIVVPAHLVISIIKESKEKVKNFVIISAGFSEIGEEGKERAKELQFLIKKYNLNILGPNCLGFINPQIKLNASFAGGLPPQGKIALVSQSGALIVALMDMASQENLGFSKIISVGNKLQLDELKLLEYLEQDKETEVVAFYLEGIKEGKKFLSLAQKIIRSKPILVLKSGRSSQAQKAISLHTGALAGSDKIVSAAFRQAGIWRADNMEEFVTFLKAADLKDKISNEEVVIITNAGGPGVLTADAFQDKRVQLAKISKETQMKLKEFLPEEASLTNPIDLLGDASLERYEKALKAIKEEKPGSILVVLTPQDQTPVQEIAELVVGFNQENDILTLPVFIGAEKLQEAREIFRENKMVNFHYPYQAVQVLDRFYKNPNKVAIRPEKVSLNQERQKRNQQIITQALQDNRKVLYYAEGKTILESYNLPVIDFYEEVKAVPQFPVVVKVDSPRILHKTDQKGVILNVNNFTELKEAYGNLTKNFPGEKIIIQPQKKIQQEMILGIKRDAGFGNVIMVGLGGIYTEILKQVEFFIPPVSQEWIEEKLKKGNLNFLFKQIRGQKPYSLKELSYLIHNFSQMALELEGKVEQVDINPLLIYRRQESPLAVDVKFLLKD